MLGKPSASSRCDGDTNRAFAVGTFRGHVRARLPLGAGPRAPQAPSGGRWCPLLLGSHSLAEGDPQGVHVLEGACPAACPLPGAGPGQLHPVWHPVWARHGRRAYSRSPQMRTGCTERNGEKEGPRRSWFPGRRLPGRPCSLPCTPRVTVATLWAPVGTSHCPSCCPPVLVGVCAPSQSPLPWMGSAQRHEQKSRASLGRGWEHGPETLPSCVLAAGTDQSPPPPESHQGQGGGCGHPVQPGPPRCVQLD